MTGPVPAVPPQAITGGGHVTGCASSQTPLRRLLVAAFPPRPPWWLTARQAWRAYGFLEWAALRAQDLAMELEDQEDA